MDTNTLAHDSSVQINQLCKRWYRGRTPGIFIVEDEPDSQNTLEARFKKAFPDIGLSVAEKRGLASSVEGVRAALSPKAVAGKNLYDVLILDHRILEYDDQQQIASDAKLQELLEYLCMIQLTTWRFMVRVTAYVSEAQNAVQKMLGGNGGREQKLLTTHGCLIEKNPDTWADLVLAYVYRTMVLEECLRLTQQFATFDFEQLNGWKPMVRIRSQQVDGLAEFEDFRQGLELLWPLLKNWPEDALQTKAQLDGLIQLIEQRFEVDESDVDLEAGLGGVSLSLLYRPEHKNVPPFTIHSPSTNEPI